MRNTCAQLEAKYGISYDTIEYLLHDELPAALPEELLTSGQRNKIRRDFIAATSTTDPTRRHTAAAEVVKRSAEHFGVSEDTIRAVVGIDGDTVRPTPTRRITCACSCPVPARARSGCRGPWLYVGGRQRSGPGSTTQLG